MACINLGQAQLSQAVGKFILQLFFSFITNFGHQTGIITVLLVDIYEKHTVMYCCMVCMVP